MLDVGAADGEALLIIALEHVNQFGQRPSRVVVCCQVVDDVLDEQASLRVHVQVPTRKRVTSPDSGRHQPQLKELRSGGTLNRGSSSKSERGQLDDGVDMTSHQHHASPSAYASAGPGWLRVSLSSLMLPPMCSWRGCLDHVVQVLGQSGLLQLRAASASATKRVLRQR